VSNLACLAALAAAAFVAQDQPQPRRSICRATIPGTATPLGVSPQVHPGRSVAFPLCAPGESAGQPLFASAVPPTASARSALGGAAVPGAPQAPRTPPPRFDEVQNVPHGSVFIGAYTSTPLGLARRVFIYLPPQYGADPARKFPVLYLRHGKGDNEPNWTTDGRAGVILDNLLARGAAVPMVIVMPNCGTGGALGGGSSPEGIEALGRELLEDVIPLVEGGFRVLPGAANRAIAGLSMGGGQAFLIGLQHPDTFAWVGEFSAGLISEPGFRLEKHLPGFLDDPAAVNRKLRLLFLSCGTEDQRYNGHLDLVDKLKRHRIRCQWFPTPGAHEWMVWRRALAEFLPKLFQPA